MRVVDGRALLIDHDSPGQITKVVPRSKRVGDSQVLVHWGLEEAQVLQNLGVENVPSPIMRDYSWPGGFTPFEHQKHTSAFLTLNRRAYVFSQQGTAKTASCIWASDYLLTQGQIRRVLIVCPVSIMDCAWRDDLFTVAMHRRVDVAHGSAAKRRKVIASDAEYVIINYDGVKVVNKELQEGGFDLIIVDEANFIKNTQADRWKALNALVKPDTWVWPMTGTPAAQSPADAYGLAKLATPHRVPKFFGAFRDQVMHKITRFKYVPRPEAHQIVHNALQPAIRYTKAECLDLPPMTYVKRWVAMSRQQDKYYKLLKNRMRLALADADVTAANAAVNLNKLLQVSCGAVYDDEGDTLEFDISARYKVLKEVIDETDNKVLVFAPFRHVIEILTEKLANDGISAEVINGAVSGPERTARFDRFQTAKDPKVLVIQPQAAAHGVTLTAADTVVWWGPVSSLEIYEQANARVDRPGQKNATTVIQLQGSGVEKHIYSLLDRRIDVHSKLTTLYKDMLD